MPQLINLKFAQEDAPRLYDPAGLEDLSVQDFVLAERDGNEDFGFVAAIEWVSTEQLSRRRSPLARIIRRATDDEKEAFFVRKAAERQALALCKRLAAGMGLPMKIAMARIQPSDGRVVFHFTSEQRVDFRQLVRELSLQMRTRVELWQIGVRDEAKAEDGYGVCGLRACCSAWLPDFNPITIRMAKDQDIQAPPVKLSGLCGRLLCCLSYEVDQYREAARSLLPKGAAVMSEGKRGVIMDRNILLGHYTIRLEDGPVMKVTADELREVQMPGQMKRMAEVIRSRATPEAEETLAEGDAAPPMTRESRPVERKAERRGESRPRAAREAQPEAGQDQDEKTPRRRRRRGRGRDQDKGAPKPEASTAPDRPNMEPGEKPEAAGDGDSSPRRRRRGRRGRRGSREA